MVTVAVPETVVYECDCPGFKANNPREFCLRCLTIWVEGLPGNFQGKALDREMCKAAVILMRRLRDDPKLKRLTIRQALEAAERGRGTNS